MIAGVKIENGSFDADHAPVMGGMSWTGWYILRTKFDKSSLNRSIDRYHWGPWPRPF